LDWQPSAYNHFLCAALNDFRLMGIYFQFCTDMGKMYLTPELIKHVEHSAKDIVWKMGVLSKLTKYWYDVLIVSPLGLIHIEGNDDTGWKHISERHGYFSNSSYFGGDALGNPSMFTRDCRPINDFRDVADDIYHQQQKDTRLHPDSEKFEKYNGISARYTSARAFIGYIEHKSFFPDINTILVKAIPDKFIRQVMDILFVGFPLIT
jgi:hypothetical protein